MIANCILPSIVCRAKIDLGFLVDGSSSIEKYGRGNFKRFLEFLKRIVVSFKVSSRYSRVGIILYSSRPRKIFGFRRYNTKRTVLRAIDRIRYPRGGTKTGSALSFARRTIFRRKYSNRQRVLIVMTDGRSSDHVARPARALRRRGVNIFAIGIGKRYNIRQLFQVASSRRNVYTSGFKNLKSIVRVIKTKACAGLLLWDIFKLLTMTQFKRRNFHEPNLIPWIKLIRS